MEGYESFPEFHVPLTYFRVQFRFVRAFPKYLKFTTSSKNVFGTCVMPFCSAFCVQHLNTEFSQYLLPVQPPCFPLKTRCVCLDDIQLNLG